MKKKLSRMTVDELDAFLATKERKLKDTYFAASEVCCDRGLLAEVGQKFDEAAYCFQMAARYAEKAGESYIVDVYADKTFVVKQKANKKSLSEEV